MEKICKQCGKPFEAKRKDKIYCEDTCKNLASFERRVKRQSGLGFLETKPTDFSQNSGYNSADPWIIKQLEAQLLERKNEVISLKTDKKEVEDNLRKTKEELAELKTNIRIADIERKNAKPSGLAGFADQAAPLFQALEIKGEHAIALLDRVATIFGKPLQKQIATGEDTNSDVAQIITWLNALDDNYRASVLQLLTAISAIGQNGSAPAIELINQLLNQINNGTNYTENNEFRPQAV